MPAYVTDDMSGPLPAAGSVFAAPISAPAPLKVSGVPVEAAVIDPSECEAVEVLPAPTFGLPLAVVPGAPNANSYPRPSPLIVSVAPSAQAVLPAYSYSSRM